MEATINKQVPGDLRKKRGLDVQENEDGCYWIK